MRKKTVILLVFLSIFFNFILAQDSYATKFDKNTLKNMIEKENKSVIYLQPGLYTEDHIKIKKPVEIIGDASDGVFIHSKSYIQFSVKSDLILKNLTFYIDETNPQYKKGMTISSKKGNINIDNCIFSGFGSAINTSSEGNFDLSNSTFNFNRNALTVLRSKSVIENCYFYNNTEVAIFLSGPDMIIRDNKVDNNKLGIYITPYKKTKNWNTYINIEGNVVLNNKAGISINNYPPFKVLPLSDLGGAGYSNGANLFQGNDIDIVVNGDFEIYAMNNYFEKEEKSEIMKKILLLNNGRVILFEGD